MRVVPRRICSGRTAHSTNPCTQNLQRADGSAAFPEAPRPSLPPNVPLKAFPTKPCPKAFPQSPPPQSLHPTLPSKRSRQAFPSNFASQAGHANPSLKALLPESLPNRFLQVFPASTIFFFPLKTVDQGVCWPAQARRTRRAREKLHDTATLRRKRGRRAPLIVAGTNNAKMAAHPERVVAVPRTHDSDGAAAATAAAAGERCSQRRSCRALPWRNGNSAAARFCSVLITTAPTSGSS